MAEESRAHMGEIDKFRQESSDRSRELERRFLHVEQARIKAENEVDELRSDLMTLKISAEQSKVQLQDRYNNEESTRIAQLSREQASLIAEKENLVREMKHLRTLENARHQELENRLATERQSLAERDTRISSLEIAAEKAKTVLAENQMNTDLRERKARESDEEKAALQRRIVSLTHDVSDREDANRKLRLTVDEMEEKMKTTQRAQEKKMKELQDLLSGYIKSAFT
eukprot:TRINITY_DN4007_c0_g1_i1.p1 TRINITY_DN4007_c0_g1~~TRINITY_DN4007_c0_g1_i1.p1  ORF type:complete len:254 (+),score=57.77 TRINITY_DN4007_c0_g1_i1:79-762(+)